MQVIDLIKKVFVFIGEIIKDHFVGLPCQLQGKTSSSISHLLMLYFLVQKLANLSEITIIMHIVDLAAIQGVKSDLVIYIC